MVPGNTRVDESGLRPHTVLNEEEFLGPEMELTRIFATVALFKRDFPES
jgi:hypothetical protein